MKLKIYNTLSKSKVEVERPVGRDFKLFVCGPTVYELAHIGHAKTYTQFDVLARTLKHLGYPLSYLQNITDIDDKIIIRAREQGVDWRRLTRQFEQDYHDDMTALNNVTIDTYARATDHIKDIIRQVEALVKKEFAYQIDNDGIYFEISRFAAYGQLSGRTEIKQDDAQSRIDESDKKRGWNDFCLWKFSKPDEPVWDAPFGAGRPGWHIEDTAITEHFFGPQYDMHGGAVDLIFPHHEAEISQMEASSGLKPFVKYWVHTGFLNIDQAKMSKSQNNFLTIKDTLARLDRPMALRLLFLQSHYRSPINYSQALLNAAAARLSRLQSLADLRFQYFDQPSEDEQELLVRGYSDFIKALADDLNTPRALSVIAAIMDAVEPAGLSSGADSSFVKLLTAVDQTLGLRLLDSADISASQKALIKQRETARKDQDFTAADKLRTQLEQAGIAVRDGPNGPLWARN